MFKTIVEDYEAKPDLVHPATVSEKARCKAEWKKYGNGEEKFTVVLRHCSVPEGTKADVAVNNGVVGWIVLSDGYGVLVRSSPDEAVPRIHAGDPIVITINGNVVFRGSFVPD